MMSRNMKSLAVLLLALCMALMFTACGKKALPKPPRYVEPPAVTNLNVDNVENEVIYLSWKIPAGDYNLKTFRVYLAQDALATLCLTCPPNFVDIGEGKSITQADGARVYTFQMRIYPGFRYVYKVNAVGRENHTGPDSNYAVYNYEDIGQALTE